MCYTPTDVLMVFIESILDDLVYQINLYRTQNNKILRIQREDMLVFIGTNFFMGYHNIPSYKNYWSTSPDLGVKLISNAMPRNTFEKILVNLHCNDNKSLPPNNKEKEISVDESMIKFKGRSSIKQYNPMKPIKRGYNIWSMADQKGYMLAFKVYQGKEENVSSEFENYGLGERVVLELTKSVE
ncbi:piggyBac transposable element-derived protein 3-like [Sipha flava]|uniref:PiggyBac transposable element-derived protein 3-like n=1 Tax=Sipha flava TaxID=143950 RepID=A0A8B8G9W7_9HEMI|nr:piggyBac transposable element-derived protein 3-like [Sipha flava]